MSNRAAWRVEAVLHAYFEESPYSDEDEGGGSDSAFRRMVKSRRHNDCALVKRRHLLLPASAIVMSRDVDKHLRRRDLAKH
jgi:hypothetical protein